MVEKKSNATVEVNKEQEYKIVKKLTSNRISKLVKNSKKEDKENSVQIGLNDNEVLKFTVYSHIGLDKQVEMIYEIVDNCFIPLPDDDGYEDKFAYCPFYLEPNMEYYITKYCTDINLDNISFSEFCDLSNCVDLSSIVFNYYQDYWKVRDAVNKMIEYRKEQLIVDKKAKAVKDNFVQLVEYVFDTLADFGENKKILEELMQDEDTRKELENVLFQIEEEDNDTNLQ